MKVIILSLFFFSKISLAFTINPSTGRGFSDNNISIHIANSDCSGAGLTLSKLDDLVKKAVNNYWNQVPTSAIFLKSNGINTAIDINGDQFSDAIQKVPTNSIVAGCNDDVTSFSDGSTLGAAVMDCTAGNCRAVLILNAHTNSRIPNKTDDEIIAIIAHEIGHAFGLGHSEYQHNLMYYAAGGKNQKWLGQDDVDGVTYLYPHDPELAGLLGSCGTINIDKEKDQTRFFFQLILGIIFSLGVSLVLNKIRLRPFF